ncbi:MAG TPA: FGGY family carbohydrate kinase [Gammaproteobacteria bacterium]
MSNILVIDQGTHASRAILVSAHGEIIDHAEKTVSLHRISHEMIEQDAEEILQSIHDVLAQLDTSELNNTRNATLTTQRSTMLAWHNKTCRAITPAVSWQDRRSQQELECVQQYAADIKTITGLPLSPHYGAGKLRWLLHHNEQVKKNLQEKNLRMGPLASFLLDNLVLNGCNKLDHSNAHRSQLFDLHTLDWSPRLLQLFDIPAEVLPRCTPMIHDYGKLRQYNIPLTCVCGDQNAALHGHGVITSGQAIINIGTGAFILSPCDEVIIDTPLLCGIASSNDQQCQYLLEGTVNGAGAALDWAQQHHPQTDLFKHLPHWLNEVTQPPIFINTIGGLGSPWWNSGTPPRFIHDEKSSVAERYVAMIESIVFLLQHNIDAMGEKIPLQQLQVSGGLSQLKGLCQKLADISQLPVRQSHQTEATALGAAWLSAGCPPNWFHKQQLQLFSPGHNLQLQQGYKTFTEEIRRLQNSG